MANSVKGFTVSLEHDISEETMDYIEKVLLMTKSVLTVDRQLSSHKDWVVETRVKHEVAEKLRQLQFELLGVKTN